MLRHRSRAPRIAVVVILSAFAAFSYIGRVRAATQNAFLSGMVTRDGVPVAGAKITASGNNVVVYATTDAAGRFAFGALAFGSYAVVARANGADGRANVDLASDGATVAIVLGDLKRIGRIAVTRASSVQGSGTDVVLDGKTLARSPYGDSFPEALIQLPGAVRGANGVVHLNGDHGVIDYLVDGVALPQALNREIGSEIDPNDVSFVDAIEGAYPAQYGLRFGSVSNITTRAGTGPAALDGNARYGSYGDVDQTLGYHAPIVGGGGLSFAIRDQRSDRGTDPPNTGSPHNAASDTNQFARITVPRGRNDFTDVTLVHSYRALAVPNDTDGGEPATTDDDERQEDTFLGDYSRRFGRNEIRAGASYDSTRVVKRYAVTLQPGNFLARATTPQTPDVATTVVDESPNVGNTYQTYLQDALRLGDAYRIDAGLRYDFFNIRSTEFAQGFGSFSPRFKVTRSFGPRANVYAYVGRFFEPFCFENVAPKAAQLLDLPLQASPAAFDLKPERDTQLEFGGHAPIGIGTLGFRTWQRTVVRDLSDVDGRFL